MGQKSQNINRCYLLKSRYLLGYFGFYDIKPNIWVKDIYVCQFGL